MTSKTRAQLTTEQTTNFADNTTGAITPSILRTTVQDMIDSTGTLIDNNSFTGNITFAPTSGNAVTVNTVTNSYTSQGLALTHSSPTSGSTAGPVSFNEIDLNYQGAVTGSTQVAGLRVNVNAGGANLSGGPVMGGYFNMLRSITGNVSITDTIGLTGSSLVTISDTAGGGGYGLNAYSGVGSAGSINRLVGFESDVEIKSGGSATYRYAVSAVNQGVGQGSTLDTAFFVGNIGSIGGAFKNMITLSNSLGTAPIASTGSLFINDAAGSIAHVFNMSTMTVTGNILNFPNVTMTGAGVLTISGNFTANAVLSNTLNDSTNSKNIASRSGTNTNLGQGSILVLADAGTATFASAASFTGSTSGTTKIIATGAASGTLTLPAATDTLVARNTTDILTNKTINTGSTSTIQISNVTISAGQYPGTTTNDSATAGNFGEYSESVIAQASATNLGVTSAKSITSIAVAAGDWDLGANVGFIASASTMTLTQICSGISTTNNTIDFTNGRTAVQNYASFAPGAAVFFQVPVGPLRFSVSVSTTFYMIAQATFAAGNFASYGTLRARRVR